MKVVINGAGIAGPTLAYWLRRHGHEPILVEEAPTLRSGGYVVDFWGVGYDIAEKMGLIPRIKALGCRLDEVRFVDATGRRKGGFGTAAFARMTKDRFTSLRRSDLSSVIYATIADEVETLFGDSIASIEPRQAGARVSFEHADPRDVDVVVGADGLHSRVRKLVFGPEERFATQLGYMVAAFEVEGYRPRDERVYVSHSTPGQQVSRFSMRDGKTLFLFVFREGPSQGPLPKDDEERRDVLRRRFGTTSWECPRILDAMLDASGIYLDRVSQIRMDRWASGPVVLVGDAAACVSLLAGEGTGLAMAEAYVLAGELERARGDAPTAFARYQDRLMPFIRRKQKSAMALASSFAPKTAAGIVLRNLATRAMHLPLVADLLIGRGLRDDIDLPDYGETDSG